MPERPATESAPDSESAEVDGAKSGGNGREGSDKPARLPAAGEPTGSVSETGAGLGAAPTRGERQAALDADLQRSLREADRLLLREQETLDRQRVATRGRGGAARGGAAELPSAGASYGATDEEESGENAEQGAAGGADAADEPDDDQLASRVPPDIPDGEDDDIVARQLREAAMNEEEPELREKLWQEYRDYKKGTR